MTGQIFIETWLPDNKQDYQVKLNQCLELNKKLEGLGYKVLYFDPSPKNCYFLSIHKKEKECYWITSILCPACMANVKRRPLPITWFLKMFDLIMNPYMDSECWTLLEKISYINNFNKNYKNKS